MINEVEKELGLQSSQTYFAQKYRENNRVEDEDEGGEVQDDGLAHSTDQNFHQHVMHTLFQYLE